MSGGWFDDEAIADERLEADMEMAELERLGNEHAAKRRAMQRLLNQGKLEEAARACPHGSGYPLTSIAARDNFDGRAGQEGWRCCHCGSALSAPPWEDRDYKVLVACEAFKARARE